MRKCVLAMLLFMGASAPMCAHDQAFLDSLDGKMRRMEWKNIYASKEQQFMQWIPKGMDSNQITEQLKAQTIRTEENITVLEFIKAMPAFILQEDPNLPFIYRVHVTDVKSNEVVLDYVVPVEANFAKCSQHVMRLRFFDGGHEIVEYSHITPAITGDHTRKWIDFFMDESIWPYEKS